MSLSPGNKDLSEILSDFLAVCARWVLGLGSVAALVGAGFLVAICFRANEAGVNPAEALHQVEIFRKILTVGVLGIGVGSTYLFWGSEVLGAFQLIGAAVLWFAPVYIPMIGGESVSNGAGGEALGGLQTAGSILGGLAIAVLLVDISIRIRDRVKQGTKADHLKYGKGIKEDTDRQNVFLGKCWQLPFCRKFVRERCPIYHSRRTCWKEKVGCMCEEQVIRGAMENKVIPKDAILAAKMIPVNHRLTEPQKLERCRNCVIYNEHQKHKYRLALPGTVIGFGLFYLLFRGPLLAATQGLVDATNAVIYAGTLHGLGNKSLTPHAFIEALLAVFMIVALSYALKIVEFVIFKLKL